MAREEKREDGGIVGVARSMFLNSGYARTTIKSIAAAAGVAPTVVSNLYANKEALFAAAMSFPSDPQKAIPALVAPGIHGMGERLVRGNTSVSCRSAGSGGPAQGCKCRTFLEYRC